MDWNAVLLFIHILSLVFWLGTDVGVFVLGKFAQNPAHTVGERLILLKVALILDMFPRVFMVLTFPTGYQMAVNLGVVDVGQYVSVGVWLFALLWLAVVLTGLIRSDAPAGAAAKRVEKLIQYLLLIGLGGVGLLSIATDAPVGEFWLAAKITLYALIVLFALLLEAAFVPAVSGFVRLESEGSSPELETQIRGGMNRTYVWVLAVYAAVIISAAFGVWQPG